MKLLPEEPTQEMWAPIMGYDIQYEVSNQGVVRKSETKKILNQSASGVGYRKVELILNGVRSQRLVHRLVAFAFCPGEPKPYVNHKNGVKSDNRAENLEWATPSENMIHSCYELGNQCKEIVAINIETGEVRKYRSIEEAERMDGFKASNIFKCIKFKRNQNKGFIFIRPTHPSPRIAELEAEIAKLKRENDDLTFKFLACQAVPEGGTQ